MTEEFAKTILPTEQYTPILIKRHGDPPEIQYDDIEEPERTEFVKTMERLGYK
jgi:hypothetical protein